MSTAPDTQLPCVKWGDHTISRLIIGHNPFKGQSHYSAELDKEMGEWYAPEFGHDLEILHECERHGINAAQFGAPTMHSILTRHKQAGGQMQWIATFYDSEDGDPVAELDAILAVDPKPIAIYYYGGRLDALFVSGRIKEADDNLKRLRDTGLLVGTGAHLPETLAHMENAEWDVDFYQACAYTVYADKTLRVARQEEETFDDADRARMFTFIKHASKPCIAFKVLGGNRKCSSDAHTYAALKLAYENVKPTDIVLVGMWQKYTDQVAQNARWVCDILSNQPSLIYSSTSTARS